MIEYLTTGVIVLLLYAAVIGVLILIGGEDELLATNDVDEGDGKALPYKIEPEGCSGKLLGRYFDSCYCPACEARASEGTSTSSTGSTEGQG